MSLHEVEQRLKSEIEVEIAAIKAAGHNTGTNALVALVERMWAYFHGDHRAFRETEANPLGLTDAELAGAAATAKAEAALPEVKSFLAEQIADYAHQRVDKVEAEVSDLSDHVVQSVGTRLMELDERVSAVEAIVPQNAPTPEVQDKEAE